MASDEKGRKVFLNNIWLPSKPDIFGESNSEQEVTKANYVYKNICFGLCLTVYSN